MLGCRFKMPLAVAGLALSTRVHGEKDLVFSMSNPLDASIVETLGGDDFLWTTATAAYQVEGAWDEGGRQRSIWDNFSQRGGHTANNQTGNVADDFYHRFEGDLDRIQSYGFNAFRLSISWPRIFPLQGTEHSANPVGVEFYRNVTKGLLRRGITPIVTMYHWDLPEDLDWLDSGVVPQFVKYADFLFETFPEVTHWATFNEPWTFCTQGYGGGTSAPGHKSKYDQYICGHHLLQAHALTVKMYREKYQAKNQGSLGMVINYDWTWPLDPESPKDLKAVQCSIDFWMAWFADPIYFGDYPECMKERLGEHLPRFTEEEKEMLKGSVIGPYLLNTYGGRYATWDDSALEGFRATFQDLDGKSIGPRAESPWLYVVPEEIRRHLEFVSKRYQPDGILVTESGCDAPGENEMPLEQALRDQFRVDYYRGYVAEAAKAVRDSGVRLVGYAAWSLMDNFEWSDGYSKRFGITYVNYTTQERYPKASAQWFHDMIKAARSPAVAEGGRSFQV